VVRANFAKKILGISNSVFLHGTVQELSCQYTQTFDYVLCLGLLYHSWQPEKIIRDIAKITHFAIFETIADTKSDQEELINNPSITKDGYLPTIPWLQSAFKRAGFTKIERMTPDDRDRQVFTCIV
jgi:hypothetical protein